MNFSLVVFVRLGLQNLLFHCLVVLWEVELCVSFYRLLMVGTLCLETILRIQPVPVQQDEVLATSHPLQYCMFGDVFGLKC